jgi:hypothetical protein
VKAASNGRFTLRGSAEAEARAATVVAAVRAAIEQLPRTDWAGALLIGGYGRGEGGVERGQGGERLHNNMDFLVIERGPGIAAHRPALDATLRSIAHAHDLGIDLGAVHERALASAPCLVMWHDARFGHKTVTGDNSAITEQRRFRPETIVPWDVESLLVNRATLLLLNLALMERGENDPGVRRTVIKHLHKAIIGYGDAVLFHLGDYHASYVEKAVRMRARRDVPALLRVMYEEAAEFRFEPRYEAYEGADLRALLERAVDVGADTHLFCSRKRTGTDDLDWRRHAEAVLRRSLLDGAGSVRSIARKGLTLLRSRASTHELSPLAALGLRAGGDRALFAATLPACLYGVGDRSVAAELLGARSTSDRDLRTAYLLRWTEKGDVNGAAALARMGLHLAEEASPS